jgi:copper oxidase (laccase) domain-containing protein
LGGQGLPEKARIHAGWRGFAGPTKKKKADAYAKQAKEWADKRVATVGNQISVEKSKNMELEKELGKAEEKTKDMFNIINWYEKKFGKAPDNLPKIK